MSPPVLKKLLNKFEWVILLAIVVLAFAARLYKINNPIADWHSWRQADTSSVTRMFAEKGVNFLTPIYQDISNVPSGKDNPNGYRMVEAPIYNLIHLAVYKLHPQWGIDLAGRLTSSLISLISLVLLYLIVRKFSGKWTGLIAALLFAVLPFNIYYSRVVLPEPLMIAFTLTFLLAFIYAIPEKKSGRINLFLFFSSSVFLALALLVKPYAIFFTLPLFYLVWERGLITKKNLLFLTVYWVVALLPFILWRINIAKHPEGIPASAWLFNNMGIRFRPAWFRWLFGVRLGDLILGKWGLILLGFGLVAVSKVEGWVYRLLALGVLIYFSVIAGGNVQHDYYQAITTPAIIILVACGITAILKPTAGYSRVVSFLLVGLSSVLMLFLSWYEIKGYYQINNPSIIEAGQAVDRLTPKDARVIADYQGDTAFLYQTDRFGWPIVETSLTKMVNEMGAGYYVSVNYDDQTNRIMNWKGNEIIEKNPKFVIVKLSAKIQP